MTIPQQIQAAATASTSTQLERDARHYLDEHFPDIDIILGHVDDEAARYARGKRRRTLREEIDHWEREENHASAHVCTMP